MVLRGAEEHGYDRVPYEDLRFDELEWPNPEHIRNRSQRKGSSEIDLQPEWANEAVGCLPRVVGDAGSRSRRTVRVTGYSDSPGRVLTVLLLPQDRPPAGRWYGVTAWVASAGERREFEARRIKMTDSGQAKPEIEQLITEEAEAERRREAGEEFAPGVRNRTPGEAGMVYHLRIPARRLEQLRQLAEQAGMPPSALARQWVLERLDAELGGRVEVDPRMRLAVRLELERAGLIK